LTLLEELSETSTTVEQEAGGGIEIRTELGEGSDFTVLGEVQLQGTSELLHDLTIIPMSKHIPHDITRHLRLGGGTDTRHRETDVDGRSDTTEEELSLQEDLTVSDGNDLFDPLTRVKSGEKRKGRTLVGM
jgi:hypothetical protein